MKKMISKLLQRSEAGAAISVLIISVFVGFINSGFYGIENIIDILRNASFSFIIACPLTLLLISGGTDLSTGSMTSLGGVVGAVFLKSGWGVIPSILMAVLSGIIFGYIKSIIVVSGKLPAFITTLGLRYVIDGIILIYTLGDPIVGLGNQIKPLGQGKAFGVVYWSVIISLVVGVVFQIVLRKMRFGREVCAVGGNPETARLAGINIKKTSYIANILVSVFAGLVGVIYASRFNSAQPTIGTGTELTILASCIIGGASPGGGSGSMVGTFLGVLLLAVIKNGLVLVHMSTYWQNLVFGAVLIISLYVDKLRREKAGGGI